MTSDQQKKLTEAINLISGGRFYTAQIILRKLLSEAKSHPFANHWEVSDN